MSKMSDAQLLALVSNAEQEASIYNGEFSKTNARLLKDYLQEPYGDEVQDQSSVVDSSVQDVVESDMPSLARVFLGTRQPIMFESNTESEAELKEVEEKNVYVNHLIMNQPTSYSTIMGWLKDAEIQMTGIVKYFFEDTVKTKETSYENVSESELAEILESLHGKDIQKVEIIGQNTNEDGTYNITFKTTCGTQTVKIINVPTEQFLISKNASCIEEAELVGDRVSKTRGQLLSEGFKKSLIEKLPTIETDRGNSSETAAVRNAIQGGSEDDGIQNWASEKVELRDLYVLIDYDGDGIAERRHILKSGNHILKNEAFDHEPYAMLSGVPMPHQAIGRSRGQLVQQAQRTKTVVLRQTLNNMYAVNHPRTIAHPDVNIDDLLNIRLNGIIRMEKGTQVTPQNAVMPMVTPFIGDKSLMIMQYLDALRAQSTGINSASQGLDAEAIANESATRFQGTREDSKAKIELVARTFSETGFRKLYEGVAWMVSMFQDTESEIKVLGKPLTVNPKNWKYDHHVVSKIGHSAGDNEKMIASMQGILGIQQQLAVSGSPLVDQVKFYNVLEEITKGLGFKQTDMFFNNPEQPDQLLQAENEILKKLVEQLQQQAQENPLAEAEQVRAQAVLIQAQGKAQIEAAKISEQVRQFDDKIEQQAKEHDQELALKLTELEQKVGQQLDNEVADNVLTFNAETGNFEGVH